MTNWTIYSNGDDWFVVPTEKATFSYSVRDDGEKFDKLCTAEAETESDAMVLAAYWVEPMGSGGDL